MLKSEQFQKIQNDWQPYTSAHEDFMAKISDFVFKENEEKTNGLYKVRHRKFYLSKK